MAREYIAIPKEMYLWAIERAGYRVDEFIRTHPDVAMYIEDEIRKGRDELVDWIDNYLPADFFIEENAATLAALSAVSQWATMNKVYTPAAKVGFVSVADSWIIAEALSQSVTVVTYETPDPACRKRVKIPDVCNAVGVKYCNLNEAFRALEVTI